MMQRACRENLTYFFSVSGWCLCSDSLCQIFSRWKNLRKWIWGWNNSAMENWRIKERNGYCSVYFLGRLSILLPCPPPSVINLNCTFCYRREVFAIKATLLSFLFVSTQLTQKGTPGRSISTSTCTPQTLERLQPVIDCFVFRSKSHQNLSVSL